MYQCAGLADLVMRLIDRNPATRIKWPAVCSHSVWKSSPLPLYPLPNEPSFQQYASQSHASELTRGMRLFLLISSSMHFT